jgi:hypothetical protein
MTSLNVLLLTQDNCEFCDFAEDVLRRLSAEFPLSISTMSLDSPEGRRLAQQNGILFAPGLCIEGEAFSYGRPSERKLRKAIEARLSASRIPPSCQT